MAAALAEGETTIFNAACEPHIQDLCHLLVRMGSTITGIGSNRLTVIGSKKLKGASYALGFDYMEAGSFIGLSAATCGEMLIKDVDHQHLRMLHLGFERIGIAWEMPALFNSRSQNNESSCQGAGRTDRQHALRGRDFRRIFSAF